tara:strand:- start:4018 stop:4347 length:330 start_codon:yes stop_codon:yes gene_type:complete
MRAGHCNISVKVERATLTRDDFGHQSKSFATHYSELYVAIRTPRATAAQSADGDSLLQVVQFTTPWHDDYDILPGDRIVWDGDDWEIMAAHDRNGYRRFVDLTAKRVTR